MKKMGRVNGTNNTNPCYATGYKIYPKRITNFPINFHTKNQQPSATNSKKPLIQINVLRLDPTFTIERFRT